MMSLFLRMARFLIIGYGNPLKSDDGLGWHVADQLSRQLPSPEVKVIRAHQLMPELAEEVSHAEFVVFIDAREGGLPGEINRQVVDSQERSARVFVQSHDLSPASILQLANELYRAAPRACLLTVSGEHFEDGDSLSQPVLLAVPRVIAEVKKLISIA